VRLTSKLASLVAFVAPVAAVDPLAVALDARVVVCPLGLVEWR
jgi:hypothetical protein